jgi:FKBP-type peptidyl-prolyl cis-trans isomerase
MIRKFLLLFIIPLLLFGCSSYSEEDLSNFDTQIQQFIEKNNLEMSRLENGLYYNILEEDAFSETIKYTDQVTFYYTGKFLDGEIFQIITENEKLTYKVNQLIVGWQEALMLMHGKGTIEIIIPPQLGYGTKKTDKIPSNSILYYKLNVTDVK